MNILVTGAGGFIGRHLCARLTARHTVFGVARDQRALPEGTTPIVADLSTDGWTETLPAAIDVVVALAQSRHHREFPNHASDLLRVNVASLVELLDWSRRSGIRRFVYASSGNVYAPSRQPIDEHVPPSPTSFYGRTKQMAEMAVASYTDFFPVTVLRPFTVYGPAQDRRALIPLLIERIVRGQPVTLAGSDGLMLTPIYGADVCRAIERVLATNSHDDPLAVFNLGGPQAVGIRQIAHEIGAIAGHEPRFESQPAPNHGEGEGWMADSSRFEQSFGMKLDTRLEVGLRATWADMIANDTPTHPRNASDDYQKGERAGAQPSGNTPQNVLTKTSSESASRCSAGRGRAPAENADTPGAAMSKSRSEHRGESIRSAKVKPSVSPFTWAAYATYLEAALSSGYVFIGFDSVRYRRQPSHRRFVLLRHDIDYDPQCVVAISRLEAERGVQATYFFQPSSPFYGFEEKSTQRAIEQILLDGHKLALHFDATEIDDDRQVIEQVEQVASAWERRYGATIDAVSFHMPSHRPIRQLVLQKQRINTYAPDFFQRFDYLSDSNQDWRGRDPLRVFLDEQPPAVQWLTHPMWWRETYRPMLECLSELAQRLNISVERDILTPEQWALLKRRREAA